MVSHTWQVILGILMIVVAGMYPMAAVYRLNKRLGRPGTTSAWALGTWLAFTLSFPFALALTGAGLVAPRLGRSPLYLAVVGGFWAFALVAGVFYFLKGR